MNTDEGHEHLPVWPKSVIIVCEEVDTLECPSADMKYRLRRVTTLEWEVDGCWLPFEPSLEHMRFIVCGAKGGAFLESIDKERRDSSGNKGIDLNVFCDPEAVISLLS